VPSIVYGIIGLTAFARMFGVFGTGDDETLSLGDPDGFLYLMLPFGQSVLSGGLTLMLVILPVVIISSQEAFRAVPASLRQASLAMGATTWQTVWNITLPAALPTILTGTILAISRAIGEAAPLLVLGVPLFISNTPANLMDDFTVLPFQIFDWAKRPQADFQGLAAAAIVVLLVVLLSFNVVAVVIRQKLHRPLS
jgi:phosphate transport system permease protein